MKNDLIDEEMKECGADGVDFVPLFFNNKPFVQVIASFTKKLWETQAYYPKTDRRYWKLDESGNKKYLRGEKYGIYNHEFE